MSSVIAIAIRLISARNCSEHELKKRLEKKIAGVADAEVHIEAAIVRLRELHLVNDKRLAEHLALRYRHKGNRFIAQVLCQKGIDDEIISQTLCQLEGEYGRAMDEARKKSRPTLGSDPLKTKARLYRFLAGRGFSHEVINATVNQLSHDGLFDSPGDTL